MLKIKGKAIRKERAGISAPDDGVHRNGKDGKIKGSHCFFINDELVPHGMVSFYVYRGGEYGTKVYYSIKHGHSAGIKWVRDSRARMKRLANKGLSPMPGKIVKVKVDINYKDKCHKKKEVYGLQVEHVHVPMEIYEPYMHGNVYVFDKLDQKEHPDHNPQGYLKFKRRIKKALSKVGKKAMKYYGDSYKMGDVLYCTKKKKWMIVDTG